MKRYRPIYIIACVFISFVLLGWWLLSSVHFDVLQPSGAIAKQQRSLLFFALILSAIVVLPVFTMLGIFAWKYRAGAKHEKYRPEWKENTILEALWWGIPILVVIILAVTNWRSSHILDPYRPIASDNKTIEIKVIALQWKWLFMYQDDGVASVNEIVIPEQTPIHFTISADAPMSSFWVPALGGQIYAMNGMSSQLNLIADKTGTFEGYNTNINGKGYSDMKFQVQSVSRGDYAAWVRSVASSKPNLTDDKYHELEQPNVVGQSDYVLSDRSLYDRIVEKYMPANMMDNNRVESKN
ncbi:MAG: cytochrome c oxidase subunit II transmembrane domain-containing protein [Candidatus Saccharimonas sp.]